MFRSAQAGIMAPPVQSDLLGFVYRAYQKTYLDSEQLDVGEVDFDVASNHQPFVQHAVQNFDQTVTA